MDRVAEIDELHPVRDKPVVFAWLRSHLRWHLEAWSRAFGLTWSDRVIAQRIDDRDLVTNEWKELVAARDDEARFVGVARAGRRAVGIVYAEERVDRYLDVPIGVLSWLFVEPLSRGGGVAVMLLDAARAWMIERGLPAAEVMVTAENPAAVRAYGKGGYEVVDHRMVARFAGNLGGVDRGLGGALVDGSMGRLDDGGGEAGDGDEDEDEDEDGERQDGRDDDGRDDDGDDDGVDWIDEP